MGGDRRGELVRHLSEEELDRLLDEADDPKVVKRLTFVKRLKGVIEEFSHRDHGASRIVSTFVVGNCDDETKAQSEEHLRSCVNAASGVRSPEAAVLH
ncbi:hypothetical protein SAMN05443661_106138 [Natronobacterium gregoryi]|uniref:Uncharacterized protein n=2 Tax=Natronobacterium gregoryi TaxID=44930 RepID=L0ADJ4_NATGS|nr:hypothetical protein Natgr_0244 [Natronobacterium gregoryi SP2]SFI83183.1 hypothetical protein SAMN05443661_106138 [Natronobacterium gregoryi]